MVSGKQIKRERKRERMRSQDPNSSPKGTLPMTELPSMRLHLLKLLLPPSSTPSWE
jgi:hypothetical protein